MYDAVIAQPGDRGRISAPIMRLSEGHQKAKPAPELELALQATTEVNSVPSSVLLLQRELGTLTQVPGAFASIWFGERMRLPRIDSCHGKRAIEVAKQCLRGKNYESESKPETRSAGWPTATGRSAKARSRWPAAARWPAEAWSAAARRPAVNRQFTRVSSEAPHDRAGLRQFYRHSYRSAARICLAYGQRLGTAAVSPVRRSA